MPARLPQEVTVEFLLVTASQLQLLRGGQLLDVEQAAVFFLVHVVSDSPAYLIERIEKSLRSRILMFQVGQLGFSDYSVQQGQASPSRASA